MARGRAARVRRDGRRARRIGCRPKGDPPAGFALVLDDTTIVLPERPGNRRADGFRNILRNPRVGLVFVIPGRGDTLRINGRATIVRNAPFFDDLVVKGHRPALAVVVDVEEVFFHCSKAFLRSKTWNPRHLDPRRRSAARRHRPGRRAARRLDRGARRILRARVRGPHLRVSEPLVE